MLSVFVKMFVCALCSGINCLRTSLVTVGYPPFTDTGKVNTQAGSQIRDTFRAVCVCVCVCRSTMKTWLWSRSAVFVCMTLVWLSAECNCVHVHASFCVCADIS